MQTWDIFYNDKCMKAIGNRKLYDFLRYLASTPLEQIQQRYKRIEKKLEKLFVLPSTPADRYKYLVKNEYMLSKYMIKHIDEEFLNGKLKQFGIVDDIQIIFDSFTKGTSASTSRYGRHCLIRLDLYKYLAWEDRMNVFNAVSIGQNGCNNVLSCILKTVAHEVCHCLLQLGTPIILDGDKIIIRSKDPFKHMEMIKIYKDTSFINNQPHFTFGQVKNEFGLFDGNQTVNHMSFFMKILQNRFGQSIAEHSLYKLKF